MQFLLLKRTTQTSRLRRLLFALMMSFVLASASHVIFSEAEEQAQLADEKIAFVSMRDGNFEIYLMDADGRNSRPLPNTGQAVRGLTWSPDSQQLAFAAYLDEVAPEVYVVDINSKKVRNLTRHPAYDTQPAWGPSAAAHFVSPAGKRPLTWGWLKQFVR